MAKGDGKKAKKIVGTFDEANIAVPILPGAPAPQGEAPNPLKKRGRKPKAAAAAAAPVAAPVAVAKKRGGFTAESLAKAKATREANKAARAGRTAERNAASAALIASGDVPTLEVSERVKGRGRGRPAGDSVSRLAMKLSSAGMGYAKIRDEVRRYLQSGDMDSRGLMEEEQHHMAAQMKYLHDMGAEEKDHLRKVRLYVRGINSLLDKFSI